MPARGPWSPGSTCGSTTAGPVTTTPCSWGPRAGRWASAEKLLNRPAYDYAQAIAYNDARVPNAGSAIFLHVGTGGPTAGCVSVPAAALVALLRWQGSYAQIEIS